MRSGAIFCPSTVSQTKVLHPARNTFVHDNKHMCALFFSPPMHNRLPMSLPQAPAWLMIAQRTMNYIELQLSCLKPQLGSRSTARSKPGKMESHSHAAAPLQTPHIHLTDTSQTPHRHLTYASWLNLHESVNCHVNNYKT